MINSIDFYSYLIDLGGLYCINIFLRVSVNFTVPQVLCLVLLVAVAAQAENCQVPVVGRKIQNISSKKNQYVSFDKKEVEIQNISTKKYVGSQTEKDLIHTSCSIFCPFLFFM